MGKIPRPWYRGASAELLFKDQRQPKSNQELECQGYHHPYQCVFHGAIELVCDGTGKKLFEISKVVPVNVVDVCQLIVLERHDNALEHDSRSYR